MLSFIFGKKEVENRQLVYEQSPLVVDVHAHVLPNLDDGAKNLEESLLLLNKFAESGYKKIIATPHIMSGFYGNSAEQILRKLEVVQQSMKDANINIQIEAAAEYYLDADLLKAIEKNEPLLTFGGHAKFLLFETPLVGRVSSALFDVIIKIKKAGYTPVLAHPERYLYLYREIETLKRLRLNGALFQCDINSLGNYYSRMAKESAEMLINQGMVSFLGTNCHSVQQFDYLKESQQTPHYQIAIKQRLLNNSLL